MITDDEGFSLELGKYPHRSVMTKLRTYTEVQDIILPMLQDGSSLSYEEISFGIRNDPRVVSINGRCKLCFPQPADTKKIIKTCSYFSDSSMFYKMDGSEYVRAIDLFYAFRQDFLDIGLSNEFELLAVLKAESVVTTFDSVKMSSLIELCNLSYEDIEKEELKDDEEPLEDSYDDSIDDEDIDYLTDVVYAYISNFPDDYVPFEKIRHDFTLSKDTMLKICAILKKKSGIKSNDSGIGIFEQKEIPKPEYSEVGTAVAETEVTGTVCDIEEVPRLNDTCEKSEPPDKETRLPLDESLRIYLTENPGKQIPTQVLSRVLKAEMYEIENSLDKLRDDPHFCITSYGVTYNTEIKRDLDSEEHIADILNSAFSSPYVKPKPAEEPEHIKEPSPVKSSDEPRESEKINITEDTDPQVVDRSLDRDFIISLFDGKLDYQTVASILATYYRKNSSTQMGVGEIQEILKESPYVISKGGTYRLMVCPIEDFNSLVDSSIELKDGIEFDKFFERNRQQFQKLGFVDSDEAYGLYIKKHDAKFNTPPEPETPDVPDSYDHGYLKSLILETMADERKRSVYTITESLKKKGSVVQHQHIREVLDELHDQGYIFQISTEMFRYTRNRNCIEDSVELVAGIRNCVYNTVKLFSNYRDKWVDMGVRESAEVLDLVKRMDRVSVIKDGIVSFDGCKPEEMIYSKKYSKEILQSHYGLPPKWVRNMRH